MTQLAKCYGYTEITWFVLYNLYSQKQLHEDGKNY